MTDREALLAAICANPDDDTPRLAFADWLEENGEPERAEFIRLQVLMARNEDLLRDDWPNWQRLCAREKELLQAHDERWWDELPDASGYRLSRIFSRGFVEGAFVTDWHSLIDNLDRIFARCPLVSLSIQCRVEFDWPESLEALARFQYLRFWNHELAETDLLSLLEAPLPMLRSLSLVKPTGALAFLSRQLESRFGDRLHYEESWIA